MKTATDIIKLVARESDKAILFHSASGKDSIALLDLMHPYFREIVCVYMYIVKDLRHINRYLNYAQNKYTKARFVQVPHYTLGADIKNGYLGMRQNPNQRQYSLADITGKVRERTGIDWCFFGFKQSDGLNRRLMLRQYEWQAICRKTMKCYPLSTYKNADVLEYIRRQGLITPLKYGKGQSADTDINDVNYLLWLRQNYPNDLQKVFQTYPYAERFLFEYDYKAAHTDESEKSI